MAAKASISSSVSHDTALEHRPSGRGSGRLTHLARRMNRDLEAALLMQLTPRAEEKAVVGESDQRAYDHMAAALSDFDEQLRQLAQRRTQVFESFVSPQRPTSPKSPLAAVATGPEHTYLATGDGREFFRIPAGMTRNAACKEVLRKRTEYLQRHPDRLISLSEVRKAKQPADAGIIERNVRLQGRPLDVLSAERRSRSERHDIKLVQAHTKRERLNAQAHMRLVRRVDGREAAEAAEAAAHERRAHDWSVFVIAGVALRRMRENADQEMAKRAAHSIAPGHFAVDRSLEKARAKLKMKLCDGRQRRGSSSATHRSSTRAHDEQADIVRECLRGLARAGRLWVCLRQYVESILKIQRWLSTGVRVNATFPARLLLQFNRTEVQMMKEQEGETKRSPGGGRVAASKRRFYAPGVSFKIKRAAVEELLQAIRGKYKQESREWLQERTRKEQVMKAKYFERAALRLLRADAAEEEDEGQVADLIPPRPRIPTFCTRETMAAVVRKGLDAQAAMEASWLPSSRNVRDVESKALNIYVREQALEKEYLNRMVGPTAALDSRCATVFRKKMAMKHAASPRGARSAADGGPPPRQRPPERDMGAGCELNHGGDGARASGGATDDMSGAPTPCHADPVAPSTGGPVGGETCDPVPTPPSGSGLEDPPPWPSLAAPCHRRVLADTWDAIRGHHEAEFADALYNRLFGTADWSRKMFSHIDMMLQKKLFTSSFGQMLDDDESLKQLALHHSHMNVKPEQVAVFCRCLKEAVLEALPAHPAFSPEDVSAAWDDVLAALQERFSRYLTRYSDGIRTLEKGDEAPSDAAAVPTEYLSNSAEIPADHCGYLYEVRLSGAARKKGFPNAPKALHSVTPAIFSRPLHPSPKRVEPEAAAKVVTPPMTYLMNPPGETPPPAPAPQLSESTVASNPLDDTFGIVEYEKLPPRWTRGRTVRRAGHPVMRRRGFGSPDPPPAPPATASVKREPSPVRLRDLGPVRKKRWVELKGQYLFYYSRPGGAPVGVVAMSECEVVDIEDEELSFSFALKRLLTGEDTLTFMADGDHTKEIWFMKLKRSYNRFSFVRPIQVGQNVRVKMSEAMKARQGICLWVGSVVGTPLAWKGSGLWVGAELTEPIEGGHDGTFRGWSFFKCSPGRGVLVPAYRVESLDNGFSLADGIAHYRPHHFDFLAVLGKGSFGCVCKVREKRTGVIYACKVLQKAALVREKQVRNLHREKSLLFKVSHPYIVKLHAAFQTRGRLLLLFDFLSGGELWFHLSNTKGGDGKFMPFEEERALFYIAEVALAVGYLHEQNILHRDLKLENLVLDSEGHVVLTDFGFAKTIDATTSSTTRCGTVPYMAPEVITKRGYGFKIDWWSLGVVLFIMLTGCYPFWVSKDDGILDSPATMDQIVSGRVIRPGNFPDGSTPSEVAQDLCCQLLQKNPAKRLADIENFKNHAAFRSFSFSWELCMKRQLPPPFVPNTSGYNTKYFQNFSENEELSNLTIASASSVGGRHFRAPSGTNVPVDAKDNQTRKGDQEDCPFAHFTGVRHPSTHGSDDPLDLNLNRRETNSLYIFEAEM